MLVFVGDVGFSLWISLVAGGRVGVGVGGWGCSLLFLSCVLRLACLLSAPRSRTSQIKASFTRYYAHISFEC